jgi:hypothetical protein
MNNNMSGFVFFLSLGECVRITNYSAMSREGEYRHLKNPDKPSPPKRKHMADPASGFH